MRLGLKTEIKLDFLYIFDNPFFQNKLFSKEFCEHIGYIFSYSSYLTKLSTGRKLVSNVHFLPIFSVKVFLL